MAAKKKRAIPTPTAFFETLVPRVLRIMEKTCGELGGRYTVDVEGQGAWTLDFTTRAVTKGAAASSDVTLYLDAKQYESLSTGKIELLKLVHNGSVRCEGDQAKVENVSLVLAFLE